jgi:tripartite-type tricarboxylate transporter receptor subunit TctC
MMGQWKCWKIAWLALVVLAVPASAQTYPDKAVRIISDSAPGSAVDVGLRTIADGLSQHWRQQVVIENRPGAGGAISARVAAALSVFLTLPGKAPNLPVVVPRDFVPIGFTAEQPMSVGVSPKLGVNTLAELIALAKQKPGEISYAVSGVGRLTHMTGELLQMRAGIKLQMIPYTAGAAHALSDIIGGRIPVVIEGYSGLAGAYNSGQLKALAIATEQRLPALPDLPTVAETVPGLVASGWQVVVAPLGTPDALVRKASADLRAVLVKPEVKDKLVARGGYVRPMTPEQAVAFVGEQQKMWAPALEQIAKQAQ